MLYVLKLAAWSVSIDFVPVVSAARHEASEGDGAAREKPERTVGETGEVQ